VIEKNWLSKCWGRSLIVPSFVTCHKWNDGKYDYSSAQDTAEVNPFHFFQREHNLAQREAKAATAKGSKHLDVS